VKRFALRVTRVSVAAASAGVLLFSCGEPRLAAEAVQPVAVLEVTCLNPTDTELSVPVRMTTQDGTAVDLWCGDRVEVSAGTCRVRRGDELTEVPCTRQDPGRRVAGVLVP
jgi:hypothetical protein